MSDYKYEIQQIAEELAAAQHWDYDQLSTDAQCALFERATELWSERWMERADQLRKEARENA